MKLHKRSRHLKIFLFSVFVILVGSVQAQEKQKSVEKQRKDFLKLQDERDAGAAEAKEKDVEKHRKIQTKETRKRMKKNEKRSKRLRQNKHEKNIFQRIFTRKPKGR